MSAAGHAQERPAIGGTLLLAQRANGRLVAGQLRIPARQHRRAPDQRVEPVQRQADAAQRRPHGVTVAEMRGFMRKRMAQRRRVLRGFRCQINRRAKQAEQAGRFRHIGHIDRQSGIHIQPFSAAAQAKSKAQINCGKGRPNERRAAEPDDPHDLHLRKRGLRLPHRLFCLRRLLCLHRFHRLCRGLRRGGRTCRSGRLCGRGRFFRVSALRRRCHALRKVLHGRNALHRVFHTERRCADADREQQTQQHQPPQGILQPQTDAPAQDAAQNDHADDQDT